MTIAKVKKNDVMEFIEEYKYQSAKGVEEMLNKLIMNPPFGGHNFYVFSFLKNDMKGNGEKTLIYQPRLTKPCPVDNSMLFRCTPFDPEKVEVMWIIPSEQHMKLFQEGKVFYDGLIAECIDKFQKNPQLLRVKEKGDLSDFMIKEVYKQSSQRSKYTQKSLGL